MKRAFTMIALWGAAALAAGGCTLLLATDDLIVPCTSSDACDEGLECRENACLPVDEDSTDDDGDDEGDDGEPAASG